MNGTSALRAAPRSLAGKGRVSFARGWAVFLRAALANPREVGAVMPSSPELSRRMASLSAAGAGDVVIELGAGTGAVTEALLARGVLPRHLFAVERSPELARLLRSRFPGVRVICGDACDLRQLLPRTIRQQPATVVSSLPLRSLPPHVVEGVVREIGAVIQPQGRWVQFTYAIADRRVPSGFTRGASALVWRNVPPARVDVFLTSSAGCS